MQDQMQAVEAKNLPKFSVGRINETYKKLREAFGDLCVDRLLSPPQFREVVDKARAAFPTSVPESQLMGLLTPLTLRRHSDDDLRFLARRLAGNVEAIQAGHQVATARGAGADGWNAGVIVEVEATVTKRRGWMKWVVIEAYAGPWAGDETGFISSDKGLWVIASNIGFSRFNKDLKMQKQDHLVGLQVTVYLKDSGRPDRPPAVVGYGVTNKQLIENRLLIRRRNKGVCPYGRVPMDCHNCVWGRDKCDMAVRAQTWVEKLCKLCGRVSWHNPRRPEHCVTCRSNHLHRLVEEFSNAR